MSRGELPKSAAESAKYMGEETADVAGDVSAMASKQYGRAQDMAVEAFYDAYAAMKPLLIAGPTPKLSPRRRAAFRPGVRFAP